MKNSYKYVLAISLLFVVSNIKAQIKFGPVAGLNFSTMTIKVLGVNFESETLTGFHVGVISEIPVIESFVLQPAILYSAKGAEYSIFDEDISLRPTFIEVPLNILYKYDIGLMEIFLKAGPYIAFGVGGQIETNGIEVDIDYGSGNADMKPLDFGLNFGAGVNIKNFIIAGQYGLGLANLTSVEVGNAEMKINTIGISVAYLFGN